MSEQPGPLEWRQHRTDDFEAAQTHHDARQAQIHTSMPGTIVSFDPKTMTCVVQPALQSMQKQSDGSVKPIDISPIADVPVHFPGGGGHTMTFPVRAGDECMIQFSERSIDNWHQHGGTQQPSDFRMHDINDAIVHVGLRSQPNVLANFSAGSTQIRSDDGKTVIDLDGAGGAIALTTTQAVTITAPILEIKSDFVKITGSSVQHNGRNIGSTHTHPDPQGGNVGPPQ